MENKINPLIDALPPLLDRMSFINAINRNPNFGSLNSIESCLSESEKIVSQFFVGLPRHYYFYERIVNKMIEGYRVRTPEDMIRKLRGGHTFNNEETVDLLTDHVRTAPSVFGTYLIGLGGTGKTAVINNIVRMFPKKIIQRTLGLVQIPIVKIHTPYRASRKDLCKSFFRELDSLAGTNYHDQFSRLNEPDLADQVKRKTLCHMVGTIILDEIQDLKTSKSGPSEMTLAFIKYLTNVVGVPIVFVGSFEAEEILFGNFQLASRSQGFKWERFQKDETWTYFINSLFTHRVTSARQELDQTLSDLYYELTQGVPRLVNLLHVEAQKICLHNKKQKIEHIDLLVATKNLLSSTETAVEGIKNFNTEILSRFPDLLTITNFNVPKDEHHGIGEKDSVANATAITQLNDKDCNTSPKGKKITGTGVMLDLIQNCNNANDTYLVFKENEIIPEITEIIEF